LTGPAGHLIINSRDITGRKSAEEAQIDKHHAQLRQRLRRPSS
jgi:hypothetical protein